MPEYRLAIPPRIAARIARLAPAVRRGIRAALREIARDPLRGEPLQDELTGLLKYRVRRYRIVYRLRRRDHVLELMAIGHRQTVYEELAALLAATEEE